LTCGYFVSGVANSVTFQFNAIVNRQVLFIFVINGFELCVVYSIHISPYSYPFSINIHIISIAWFVSVRV